MNGVWGKGRLVSDFSLRALGWLGWPGSWFLVNEGFAGVSANIFFLFRY